MFWTEILLYHMPMYRLFEFVGLKKPNLKVPAAETKVSPLLSDCAGVKMSPAVEREKRNEGMNRDNRFLGTFLLIFGNGKIRESLTLGLYISWCLFLFGQEPSSFSLERVLPAYVEYILCQLFMRFVIAQCLFKLARRS